MTSETIREHEFIDDSGRTWVVEINVLTVKRIKDTTSFNVVDLMAARAAGLQEISTNPVLLVEVLYCCLEEQADEAGVSPEEFARSIAGDSLFAAMTAFLAAFVNFCPRPDARKALRAAIKQMGRASDLIDQTALREAEAIEINGETIRELSKQMEARRSTPAETTPI